ncbi:unnamed protein product [Staurois parvus]|uniref:Fork-head domain-containing protein n=1 Tax=Staurois parvus TaxID=386267 RepID=A0ABN9F7F0_9NEOB|nr:unnamed protein product [Staurois parvus]
MDRILADQNCPGEDNRCPKEPDSTEHRKKSRKPFRRIAKPPYTYMAMIALVIQKAPERKLTILEICYEIGILFPTLKWDYQGSRKSITRSLYANDCFKKVLKDPLKPHARNNYWMVDVSQIPTDCLKRKDMALSRKYAFPYDLAPYILHGQPYRPLDFHISKDTLISPEMEAPLPVQTQPLCIDPAVSFPMLWNLPTCSKYVPNVVASPRTHPLLLYSNCPSLSLYDMPSPHKLHLCRAKGCLISQSDAPNTSPAKTL